MEDQTLQDIIRHSATEHPREACGVLIQSNQGELYIPCRNIAEGNDNFIMDPEDYAAAEDQGEIKSIIHSHPNASPEPSQADRVGCEASGHPWHIIGFPSLKWAYIEPTGYKAPLIGREFRHGILDCYSLIRDWYALERGITLPDFPRNETWWNKGQNLYLEHFSEAGFERVLTLPEPGDVLLMQIRSPVPNHGAVYLGDDMLMHHLIDRLSSRALYDGYWRRHTTHVLRFKGSI